MRRMAFVPRLAVAAWLWLAAGAAFAAAPDLERAQALMRQGKPAEAYALLAPLEFEQAGSVDYDYLLGIAALDSGRPDKATLAFERVLAVNPNFLGARLDMARAYYAMGDYQRARSEFEAVMGQNPPLAARLTGERYLAEIEQRLHPRTIATGYAELALGRDTNVNNAANASQIFVPLFGTTLTLSPNNVKIADTYWAAGAGGEISRPIDPGLTLYAGVDARKRMDFVHDEFDLGNLDGRVGALMGQGPDAVRVEGHSGLLYLDNSINRHNNGLAAEWRHAYTPSHQISVFGQYNRLRYPDAALKSNDVNQTVLGLGWLHAPESVPGSLVFASVYAGQEQDTADRVDGGQKFYGVRAGGQKALNDRTDIFASVGVRTGDYDRFNIAFLDYRHDRQYDASLALSWRPATNWTVRLQVTYTKIESNFDLNTYDRIDASITLRRDFR
jgi:tetratricopeptide (TPR) repeat protein